MDQTLRDIEAIHQLKARYFRLMDTKQWRAWRQLFTDDVSVKVDSVVSTFGADGRAEINMRGADAFVASVEERIGGYITVHQGHMPEIEILSPVSAKGVWAMEDIVEEQGAWLLRGYGHYHEVYSKSSGDWRIASLHLTRLRVEMHPAPAYSSLGGAPPDR